MSRASTLILFGILIILVPFSGLPISLRTALTVLFGLVVCGMGISFRARDVVRAQPEEPPKTAQ